MTTKQKILDEAMTLFAEKGYSAVCVGEIAEAVGIKAPSLYKHFKSKQDIFNAILDQMRSNYDKQAAALNINGNNAKGDAPVLALVSEDVLVQVGIELFRFFLHDDYASKFRKMLTIEQFHNSELSMLYSKQYVDDPLAYQSTIFAYISASGGFINAAPNIMALHFYAPIYMMLTMCDRQPEREKEALQLIEEHIKQFRTVYSKEGQT